MNILILEDEQEAAHRLTMLLERYGREEGVTMRFLGAIESVRDALAYFQQMPTERTNADVPDVVFVDIHLADGSSFEVFRHVQVDIPVIFTTAYNEYALHAFKVHSIAYLLKPFGYADIQAALRKLAVQKQFFQGSSNPSNNAALEEFRAALQEAHLGAQQAQKRFKTRFLLHAGETMTIVPTKDIYYFYAEGKIVSIVLENGRKYIAENTLEEIESVLNPAEFFRISRKFLLRAESIVSVEPYFNGRLALKLLPAFSGEVIVSRERVKECKAWLEGA
ncbi:MAG: DNA-binding response regulator [Candidatus Kapaibacterium sp.]|nr:MAG: DNA-binding response regulator [Candidatus Kapabacteria bacterium]